MLVHEEGTMSSLIVRHTVEADIYSNNFNKLAPS